MRRSRSNSLAAGSSERRFRPDIARIGRGGCRMGCLKKDRFSSTSIDAYRWGSDQGTYGIGD